MRTLEELKADLKNYWIENDKSFYRLREEIALPYTSVSPEENGILEGEDSFEKAHNLISEWGDDNLRNIEYYVNHLSYSRNYYRGHDVFVNL